MNNWGKCKHLAIRSGILFIPKVVLLLVTLLGHCTNASGAQHGTVTTERSQNSITAQAEAAGYSGRLSKLKSSGDAQICISFMCNFSIRLVNLKQQPYKSRSFVQARDQVLGRTILERKKKKPRKKEEGELGQLCTSDGRYLIL